MSSHKLSFVIALVLSVLVTEFAAERLQALVAEEPVESINGDVPLTAEVPCENVGECNGDVDPAVSTIGEDVSTDAGVTTVIPKVVAAKGEIISSDGINDDSDEVFTAVAPGFYGLNTLEEVDGVTAFCSRLIDANTEAVVRFRCRSQVPAVSDGEAPSTDTTASNEDSTTQAV